MRLNPLRMITVLLVPATLVVAGCGGRVAASGTTAGAISIHAAATHIDTNGTTQYAATLTTGETVRPGAVVWSVAGGDPTAGPGSISPTGLYTPPNYLTEDIVSVSVSATPAGQLLPADTAELTVTPAFLQPLTPGNLVLAAGGSVTISGSMTEVGGSGGIRFSLASDTSGTPSEAGSLSAPHCARGSVASGNPAYTVCTVTYTSPATITTSASVYILGSVASQSASNSIPKTSRSWTRVLLSSAGIISNPASHQTHLASPILLGSSSGSNVDYDSAHGTLSDCCGGTLGALVQDVSGVQYALSNNHVLARSDQAIAGETVIQPGLIDNACVPFGVGPGTTAVATLSGYPALSSAATNVDVAIARVTAGSVDSKGSILELGAKQADGALAAAPPGISSTGGKGEVPALGMSVAKSGRTTGLTCGAVSAVNVDVTVDYYSDCAETSHALTKTFTNQIVVSGENFSDAGDSGALVVDSANAEPVGLFFAGGTDANGAEQAVASPANDVLVALNTLVPTPAGPTTYSFVGGADHPVSCLSYGNGHAATDTTTAAAVRALPVTEREQLESTLPLAQLLLNPSGGIARVAAAASKDHPGEAAIAYYVDASAVSSLPNSIGGVPTMLLPMNGVADTSQQPRAASLAQVLAVKQRNATLLKSNAAIFGVGVGQSLDNPADAAVVLFVDRHKLTGQLPESIEGQRVRIVLMDRLHVTRSHGQPARRTGSCQSFREADAATGEEWRVPESLLSLPD